MAVDKIDQLEIGSTKYDIDLPPDATPSIASLTVSGAISEGGTSLVNKYLGKSAKAADADKLDGNDSTYYQKALPTTTTAGKVLKSTTTAGTVEWANDINTTYTIASGDDNGQIKVTPSSGNAYNVDVTGLGSAAYKDTGTASGNIPVLNSNGQLADSVIPAVAITDTYEASSQAAMLALTAQKGDICIRSDLNKSFVLQTTPATTLANWKELKTPTDAVLSVNGKTGSVTLSYSDVGALASDGTAANSSKLNNQEASYYLNYNNLNNKPTIDNNNQTVKGNGTAFGANAVINIVGGGSTSVAADTANNKITISATDTGATSIETTGDGNVVSSASYNANTRKITLTKGVTALTSHQSIKNLKTDNTTAQTASSSEAISGSGTINLHKISKTGSYNDLLNKPTIPTVNNGTLTIQKNGTNVQTFTANQSSDVTANITVPTTYSDIGAAAAHHLYHTWDNNTNYYDNHEGGNMFRIVTENMYADCFRFQASTVSNLEYYDGSSWVSWNFDLSNLFDGNARTGVSIPYANRKFRFQLTANGGWPTTALFMLQGTWFSDGGWPSGQKSSIIIETRANTSADWSQKASFDLSGVQGMAGHTLSSLHTGETLYRITIEIFPWTNTSNTCPLRRLCLFSNYNGGALEKVTHDGYGNVTIPTLKSTTIYENGTSLANKYLSLSGGSVTGELKLYTASGDSPRLTFQRGTLTDTYNDWSIYDSGGLLYVQQRGSSSSSWETRATFTQSGVSFVGTISEGGTSLTNKYLGKTAKAADSAKLDGHESSYFYQASNPDGYTTNTGTVIGSGLTADTFVVGNGTVNVKTSTMKPTTSSTTWSTTSDVNVPTMKAISSYVTGLGYTTNTGTVTSVSVGTGSGLSISGTSTINPTISIASTHKLPTTTEWNSKADSSALGDQVTYSYSGGVLTITSK